MDKQPARRSGLFLMELMIAILFFTLASTICVRFFVKSHTLNTDSSNLSHAVNTATSTAEVFRTSEEPLKTLTELFPYGEATDESYCVYYDSNWRLCALEDACYTVSSRFLQETNFTICHIQVMEGEQLLYELSPKKYIFLHCTTHFF